MDAYRLTYKDDETREIDWKHDRNTGMKESV